MMSGPIPARTVSRDKRWQPATYDGFSTVFLASVWAENLQLEEGHVCSELLFQFSSIELGEFEMILEFLDSFRRISLLEASIILWAQATRASEKLAREDVELARQKVLGRFVGRCIQQYAFLSYGAQCGIRNLRIYLQNLIAAPTYSRRILYEVVTKNAPAQRLKILNERFEDSRLFEQAYRLKLFWLTYDFLCEKADREAKQRAVQQPIMRQVQNRIEIVSGEVARRLTLTLSEIRLK